MKTSCTASWDEMVGDETTRFCCTCSKNVYDLTAMHPDEAEAFLEQHLAAGAPLPCARIYRRRDGRVLTSECPTGERRRHALRVVKTLVAGAAGAAMLAASVELATRPTLGPDVEDVESTSFDWASTHELMSMGMVTAESSIGELMAEGAEGESRYDVDDALRSDESDDVEPEGTGPARRRYVRPQLGPDRLPAIQTTITLVTDTTGISESSPRRRRSRSL